ncbi:MULTISPECIES: SDH family Clp fold serine proteinase [unclassified Microbacterium]|uniref:SDH family Clp fold serine proteinase n=1 Tax=unclassified Microbacterium TaxID=2609290 RepID=UPI000BBAFAC1|nr:MULTISPECIES: hypothetical protein [unclassified Microbacterium]
MGTWNELLNELSRLGGPARDEWFTSKLDEAIATLAQIRDRNVLVYFSSFLQKGDVPPGHIIMMPEDVNGFMAAFHGMDKTKGLTVLMHTPGGATMAVQSLVEYTRSMFNDVEVIVPAFAMSAGTMYALASDRIILGRQSQLGPIDPQLSIAGRQHSARSIVEQFDQARREIVGDASAGTPADPFAANLWAPILGSFAPSLLQFANDQLDFSESMVAGWLERYMFAGDTGKAVAVANFFNDASQHKSHDKRIGVDEARAQGLTVELLEDNQALQEAALTLYHILTILVEQTPTTKLISAGGGRNWVKSWTGVQTS